MAIDGLSLMNLGVMAELAPREIHQEAKQASQIKAEMKKIEEVENSTINPDKDKKQQKNNQNNQKNDENDPNQDELLQKLFSDITETAKSDSAETLHIKNAIQLSENKAEYSITYNSYKEIIEIIHIKTGQIQETLSLEELKSFIMKVKNPLGIIVDKKV